MQLFSQHKRNPLQAERQILRVAVSGCNLKWFKEISTIIANSRTTLYFAQSLQAPKSCEIRGKSCKESMLHAHCNLPVTCLAKPLQLKLQEKLHRVTLASSEKISMGRWSPSTWLTDIETTALRLQVIRIMKVMFKIFLAPWLSFETRPEPRMCVSPLRTQLGDVVLTELKLGVSIWSLRKMTFS